MPDERRPGRGPLDAALDLMFFGPIGLLASCRQVVPELAAKGREVVDQQMNIARFVGRFTVQRGQQQASRAVQNLFARDGGPTPSPGFEPDRSGMASPAAPADGVPWDERSAGPDEDEHIPVRLEDVEDEGLDTVTAESVGADELAIPSYDSLAASQVVARLEGLTGDELEAVRRYEVAHRARKTILGKIDQLQRA